MADDCDLEIVRDFILANGGKIRNADLVTRYRKFLDNPNNKAKNREKFKDIVNNLATIKKDETGEKVLVLKKKYRAASVSTSSLPKTPTDSIRAQSEPPKHPDSPKVPKPSDMESAAFGRVKSEGSLGDPSTGSTTSMETVSASSVSTADSSMSAEEDDKDKENLANMSVKERAKHLNKIESQTQLEKAGSGGGRTRKDNKGTNDGDEDSQSGYMTVGPKEREWLLTCCTADYQPMAKLLSHNPSLVKIRDFTNGFTALHWAAKHGQPEVVKMVAGKPEVNVNQRSMGGYTPLHLAAIQGHDVVIDLLISTYKADPNIRDFAGKKAKHYLRNSASAKSQQLLMSRGHAMQPPVTTSISESFRRSTSFRKSRTKALSSLMSSQFGKAQPMIRKSWEVQSDDGEVFDFRTTPPNSGKPSPTVRRKGSLQLAGDRNLMPPPAGPVRRKKSRSRSRDTDGTQFSRAGSDPNLRSQAAKSTII